MSESPEQLSIFESGAKRSGRAIRFDLIPREALEALAARLTMGANTYGEHNWQKGALDPIFQRDAANHLMAHLLDFQLHGNSMEDNTGAIIANAAFLCYFEAKNKEREAYNKLIDAVCQPEHAGYVPDFSADDILERTRPAEPVSQRIELDSQTDVGAGLHFTDSINEHKMLLEELPIKTDEEHEAELRSEVDAGALASSNLAIHLHNMGAANLRCVEVVDGREYVVTAALKKVRIKAAVPVPRKAVKKTAKKAAKRK